MDLIAELRSYLEPVQHKLSCPLEPKWPVACVVGAPRSGTTVLLQLLASTGAFSYPSNLVARFAYAPYLGARIQQMLFDPGYDSQGDFADIRSTVNLTSDLGKSKGALSTNEFQHFFRCHIPTYDPCYLSPDQLKETNFEGISKGLASLEYAFELPFATKAVLLQFNIPAFAERLPQLFFIYQTREPLLIMQSLLLARKRYYGNCNTWWSVKPKEYSLLKKMDVYYQIAGQVYFTEKAITSGLQAIPKERQMKVSYRDICKNPNLFLNMLAEAYKKLGCNLNIDSSSLPKLIYQDQTRLPTEDIESLKNAYDDFLSGNFYPTSGKID